MSDMTLWVSFPDQSASFVHGFEAGMIYQQMLDGVEYIDKFALPIHTTNLELLRDMAKKLDYDVEVKSFDDTYTYVMFCKVSRPES